VADRASDAGAPDALSELARIWRRYEGDAEGAVRVITETGCKALDVARCSVWLLDADRSMLRCLDLYERETGDHSSGLELPAAAYPSYFAALDHEEPIAADDAHTDPRTCEFSAGYLTPLGIGAMLDAPIRTGLRLVGVLCNEHVGPPRTWSRDQRKDASFLASLTSLALELRQRARHEALLTATLESTGEGIVAFDDQRVVAYNRRFLHMWGLEQAPVRVSELRAQLDDRTQQMARYLADASELLADAHDDTVDILALFDDRIFERTSRPQVLGEQVVGRVWSFRDVTGHHKAEAALRASEARMRDLATRDGLTGLYNRRHALEQLALATQAAAGTGEAFAVALLDVDHFKVVNDTHGHLVGDAVLRHLARVLGDRLRGTDLIGRYGGEEFLVVMRRATAVAAAAVLDGVRAQLSARSGSTELPRYSFSAGVGQFPDDGRDPTELLACADRRLYHAKGAGRDRVVTR